MLGFCARTPFTVTNPELIAVAARARVEYKFRETRIQSHTTNFTAHRT